MIKNVHAFASAFGQQDNLGDAILRRHMLDVLRTDCQLHVYTGTCSTSYVEALELAAEDTTYNSLSKWLRKLAVTAVSGRTVFAFNTGEVTINRRFAVSRLMSVPLRIIQAFRGGAILHIGQGIKDEPAPLWSFIGGLGVRLCSIVAWRDPRSHRFMNVGITAPDWAFVEVHERGFHDSTGARDSVTISLRGDRPYPSEAWLNGLKEYAEKNRLQIAVATQVKRDSECSIRLASDLGALLVDWTPDKSHSEQEAEIRSLYANSAAVMSDRLHVLVVAMAEGAVPVDTSIKGNHKVRNTFLGAGLSIECFPRDVGDSANAATEFDVYPTNRQTLSTQTSQTVRDVDKLLRAISAKIRVRPVGSLSGVKRS